jgi:hypothetical protein
VGTGLAFPLDKVIVTLRPGEPARVVSLNNDQTDPVNWWLESLTPLPEYVGALAAKGSALALQCWRFEGP